MGVTAGIFLASNFTKRDALSSVYKISMNCTYYKSIHVFFMRELYFEAFISFAVLLFIHEHLKFLAGAFHDFNKE